MDRKINIEKELKTLAEIAAHFPRRDNPEVVGVAPSTVYNHIKAGRLKLEEHWVKNHQYFYIPLENQLSDIRTWGLSKMYKAKRRGRPTIEEQIGLK